ncbi:MAG: exosortase C-terminal domain/associated protein EpsI, partial [Pseudomonadota bacterium]
LETDGLGTQAARLRFVRPSAAMITAAVLMMGAAIGWQAMPDRASTDVSRDSFALFPRRFGDWEQVGSKRRLSVDVAQTLGADDYHSITLQRAASEPTVEFFSAWYADQSQGGVHSPEICLPGGGWEIAWLERSDLTAAMGSDVPFNVNRAIIQKGETRMMVYYWFDQKGRNIAWDMAAKYWLLVDGVRTGRTDGALVRLTTPIHPDETDAAADARLMDVLRSVDPALPRFIPGV